MEINKIYNSDCLKILGGGYISKQVDLLLTDPPYNISRGWPKFWGRQWMDFGEWDKWFNQKEWIRYLPLVLKENANVVIFNDYKNFKEIIDACYESNITIKRCLVLNKSNPAPFNRDRMFVNDVEFALWGIYNSKNKPTKRTFNRKNPVEKCVLDTTVQSSKLHPTIKDIKVIKHLVELLSNEWDLVLDPFMWSWTTAVACKELGRNYVGCEKDPKYCDIIEKRLNGVIQKLF